MEDISIREQWFKIAVFSFSVYEAKMLDDFYNYWSEPARNGKKMRFELEKTWDIKRRLNRWFDNQNKWHGNNIRITQQGNPAGTSTKRIEALKQWGTGI